MAITNIYKGALERSDIQKIYKGTELVWQKEEPVIGEYCVIFENEGFTSISVQPKWTQADVVIQYSFNGVNWINAVSGTNIIRSDGNTIFFRGKAPIHKRLFTTYDSTNAWVTNATKITGNLNYLLCDELGYTIAPTTLSIYAYSNMFKGCSTLVTAPELPATTLSSYCYDYMFYGCSSLVNAPELPATTLSDSCYRCMFYGCSSLVNAPELPATTLSGNCYNGMFYGCSSLVNAPELPATTLSGGYCYSAMFIGCSSLTSITIRYTGNNQSFTNGWVYGITTVGTLYKAGTQYTYSGSASYPTTWRQVQI